MSEKLYCIASFEAKEGREIELLEVLKALEPITLEEEGCVSYTVTKHISHPNAMGKSYPIVFNEVWKNKEAFELHCNKSYISEFFQKHCVDKDGFVKDFNVCVYTDEVK